MSFQNWVARDRPPRCRKPNRRKRRKAPKPAPPVKTEVALPKVGNLGVNYRFEKRAKTETEAKVRESKLTPDPTALRGGQDGGDQAIMDRTLPEGSENLLKAQESVFYSFYSRLYEAIAPIGNPGSRVPRSRKIKRANTIQSLKSCLTDRET